MSLLFRLAALALLGPSLATAAAALLKLDHRWPDILVQFTAPMLIATAGLTFIYALVRLWTPAAAGLAATGLLTLAVWPQWFPNGPTPPQNADTLRLYSANLWVRNTDSDRIAASVAEADPDIVVLIELNREVSADLDRILVNHPYRVASMFLDPASGVARSMVASRWPLTALPDPRDGLHSVAVIAETPQGPIRVVGVHMTRPWPFQYQWSQLIQVQALTQLISGSPEPVIVAGDFNAVSTSRAGRMLQADTGLHPAPGWPGTWPAKAPSVPAALGMTIDQVYLSNDLAVRSRRLGLATGSDHRPVVTDIVLSDGEQSTNVRP